ncbi:hypothetical protein QY883_09620 [Pediococcus acidilactici]|uniref:hypothetical protein n=1 Tax=Pediococcus acidilactici TaxID=1254 RepID=UPI000326E027|nr:hypothetical protein [Pediococcus acidilactici]EOA07930.1 hypothetical protein PAD3_1829 [Pediococcus acidilactici D3]MBW4797751.1 hypothetical protein [Pediococcus acidilactici]MBW9307366.1 hypothetical protein [Pediococcus acidilactici]MCE5961816.1 hypothetical protein [Pediococcus acidilactici]MCW8083908.1 hypothetical protein [Pediococcus acidilactici]
MKDKRQQLYTDPYFEKGHWGLKIRQTLVALLGWIGVIVPVTITATALWAQSDPRISHLWAYPEGIFEIKFLAAVLLFAFAMAGLFAVSMTIIQNRRRDRLAEQWPTFNPINQRKRESRLEKFMTDRFGDEEFRENVKYYEVEPEQNLDTDEIHHLYQEANLDDLNKD